jgi:hypothetical protein
MTKIKENFRYLKKHRSKTINLSLLVDAIYLFSCKLVLVDGAVLTC